MSNQLKTISIILSISIFITQINLDSNGSNKMYSEIRASNEYTFILTQNQKSEPLLQITNASFCAGFYESSLEVEYSFSIYSGAIPVMFLSLNHIYIKLLLSRDNTSFIEVQRNEMDVDQGLKNGSGCFKVLHSFFNPFPFNVEKNSTLYIKLDRGYHRGTWSDWSICTTSSVAVQVPIDIESPWIYSVNFIPLLPLLMVISILGSIFFVSRRKRLREGNLLA